MRDKKSEKERENAQEKVETNRERVRESVCSRKKALETDRERLSERESW